LWLLCFVCSVRDVDYVHCIEIYVDVRFSQLFPALIPDTVVCFYQCSRKLSYQLHIYGETTTETHIVIEQRQTEKR
jgi:hypothetical protein